MENRGGFYKRGVVVNQPITEKEYQASVKSGEYKKLFTSDLEIDYTPRNLTLGTNVKEYKDRWLKPIVNRGVRIVNGRLEEIIE